MNQDSNLLGDFSGSRRGRGCIHQELYSSQYFNAPKVQIMLNNIRSMQGFFENIPKIFPWFDLNKP
ncbi:hypothetical protein [Corynebacterium felinum]|uniref:hypothetical protein n=1 Tax=Corynebacterium felinum TaxID=131318 RepID=UPI0025B296A6|nr:hypothetical protein [Corynebacterium felinum]